MGAWDIQGFKTLCDSRRELQETRAYVESLQFKFLAADYHRDRIQKKIEAAGHGRISLQQLALSDYEIAFEMDAMMMALNSMWDILAQLLNSCFTHLEPRDVSLSKLCDRPRESMPPEITASLVQIRGNALYDLINAYSSVSKHMLAIRGDVCVDFRDATRTVSYRSKPFRRRPKSLHQITEKRAFECLGFVGRSVDSVGALVHKTLTAQPDPSPDNGPS